MQNGEQSAMYLGVCEMKGGQNNVAIRGGQRPGQKDARRGWEGKGGKPEEELSLSGGLISLSNW